MLPIRKGATMLRLLSTREVCAVTSLSRSTIERLVADRQFPQPHRITPYRLAFRADEVAAWLESLVSRQEGEAA
jgi:prophage regulatory protein